MMFYLYKLGYFLSKILPRRMCYVLVEIVTMIAYSASKTSRRELKENLRIVFDEKASEEYLDKMVFRVFRNFGKHLADFFKVTKYSKDSLSKYVKFINKQYIDECLSEGKGVILLSLHIGNWELGGAALGASGYPISAIVLEHQDKKTDELFVNQRGINKVKSIPIGPKVKECFRALKKNEIVGIVGDKDYTKTGIEINFFGKKAIIPKGPAIFAVKTGAPVIVCGTIRKNDYEFEMIFAEPIKYKLTGNTEKDVIEIMKIYIKYFEDFIRGNPDQWYAFRKIWNQE